MTTCRREFDFTLIMSGMTDFDESVVDRLYQAGCDDGTVSQRYGRVFVTFTREAETFREAIVSAINDVHKADIGGHVLRVDECNLVIPSEIARRLDRTRQAVDQYIKGTRGPGGFPPPACNITDGAPLYYWCEVAHWAFQNDLLTDRANQEAQEVATINTILELLHQKMIAGEITDDLMGKFGVCRVGG